MALTKTLKDLADRVGTRFSAEAKRLRNEGLALKLFLIIGGGAAAGIAQFIDPPSAGQADWAKLLGFGGVGAATLGGFWGTFREKSTAEALDEARLAIDEARHAQASDFKIKTYVGELNDKLRRMAHLHTAHLSMREAVEQCMAASTKDEAAAADIVLQSAALPIRSAIDFQMDESWTVSVYQARASATGIELVCVAADRFDTRAANLTRTWPLGVGHTGATFAKADETVVPDLAALELGTLDRLPASISHGTDSQRYRSIAAIPVRVAGDKTPWGVVVTTSDRPHRFTLQHDEKGSLSAEVARTLAGMIALAVATQR